MSLMEPAAGPRPSTGRERLLSTARALFMRHGASNVGINDVTAAAGVARMTLYNNFSSKEALVQAVYEEMMAETLAELREMDVAGRSEEARVHDLFRRFDPGTDAGPRGCPFIHASLQAADPTVPIHTLVRAYKRALRDHILTLLDTERPDRAELADLILILLDGAVTEACLDGVDDALASARRGVSRLLRTSLQPAPAA